MTDISTLREQLAEQAALEKIDPDVIASLAQDYLGAGASVAGLGEILIPTGWRFVISKSGTEVQIERREDLWRRYLDKVEATSQWRTSARKDSMHEYISQDIHCLISSHAEINQYLRPAEGLGDVYQAIDDIFRGTGAGFDGRSFGYNDDEVIDD